MPGGASQASRIMGLGRSRKKERPVSEQTRRKRTRLQTVRADVWSWHQDEKEVRSVQQREVEPRVLPVPLLGIAGAGAGRGLTPAGTRWRMADGGWRMAMAERWWTCSVVSCYTALREIRCQARQRPSRARHPSAHLHHSQSGRGVCLQGSLIREHCRGRVSHGILVDVMQVE